MADQGAAANPTTPVGSTTATAEEPGPAGGSVTIIDIVEPFPGFLLLLVLAALASSVLLVAGLVRRFRSRAQRP